MTITEMLDYIADCDINGYRLTEAGRQAAILILTRRSDWTEAHKFMLSRLENGVEVLPHKLWKLCGKTRLGDALELARKLTRKTRKNQKARARAKVRKARAAATAAA